MRKSNLEELLLTKSSLFIAYFVIGKREGFFIFWNKPLFVRSILAGEFEITADPMKHFPLAWKSSPSFIIIYHNLLVNHAFPYCEDHRTGRVCLGQISHHYVRRQRNYN